jgi:hypothetical protein
MRDALRRRYQSLSKRHRPTTPSQQEALAIRVLRELDSTDHLELASASSAERLRVVVQRIVNPRCPWTD